MNFSAPIRSRAADEGNFEIPLWSIPLILVVLYVCLFSGLGVLGLVGPDEPRYAAIARAMAETHDWVTPRLWGTPWFEKPVLYYWAAGMAMRLFGVSEFAARLPSALAALLAVVAVAWTALRSYGLGAAWYSLLMLPTSVAMIGFSRAASPDMLFSGLLTAAMAVAVEMLQKERPGAILRIAFGFFLGAAVLAKGPAAVILAGGATLLWAAISRQWLAPFRFLHPLVIAAFCATALPWYVLCALRNPDFLRVFIWQHNFERYLTPIFQHPQPFWFYVPILATAVAPWIVMLVAPLCVKWREKCLDSPTIFVLSWALFPFLFFTFSRSKLPGYVLPSIPPVLLLISRAAGRLLSQNKRNSTIWVGGTGVMLTLTAAISERTLFAIGHAFRIPDSRVTILLLIVGLGGVAVAVLEMFRKALRALAALACLIAALIVFMNAKVLPIADSHISARSAARDCLRLDPSGNDIAVFGLTREWKYGMNNYFNRELPEWMPGTPAPEWLLTNGGDAREMGRLGDNFHVVSRTGEPFAVVIHVIPPENLRH